VKFKRFESFINKGVKSMELKLNGCFRCVRGHGKKERDKCGHAQNGKEFSVFEDYEGDDHDCKGYKKMSCDNCGNSGHANGRGETCSLNKEIKEDKLYEWAHCVLHEGLARSTASDEYPKDKCLWIPMADVKKTTAWPIQPIDVYRKGDRVEITGRHCGRSSCSLCEDRKPHGCVGLGGCITGLDGTDIDVKLDEDRGSCSFKAEEIKHADEIVKLWRGTITIVDDDVKFDPPMHGLVHEAIFKLKSDKKTSQMVTDLDLRLHESEIELKQAYTDLKMAKSRQSELEKAVENRNTDITKKNETIRRIQGNLDKVMARIDETLKKDKAVSMDEKMSMVSESLPGAGGTGFRKEVPSPKYGDVKCEKCGGVIRIDADARFCHACGHEIGKSTTLADKGSIKYIPTEKEMATIKLSSIRIKRSLRKRISDRFLARKDELIAYHVKRSEEAVDLANAANEEMQKLRKSTIVKLDGGIVRLNTSSCNEMVADVKQDGTIIYTVSGSLSSKEAINIKTFKLVLAVEI
jgi:hypothetical protein